MLPCANDMQVDLHDSERPGVVAADAMGRRQSTALAIAVPLEAAGIHRHCHREQQPFVRRV